MWRLAKRKDCWITWKIAYMIRYGIHETKHVNYKYLKKPSRAWNLILTRHTQCIYRGMEKTVSLNQAQNSSSCYWWASEEIETQIMQNRTTRKHDIQQLFAPFPVTCLLLTFSLTCEKATHAHFFRRYIDCVKVMSTKTYFSHCGMFLP